MITKITAEGSQILDDDKWQFSLDAYGALSRPPIVAGDRLVCFTDSLVFALDIYTGEEVTGESGFPHYLSVSDDPPLPTHSRGTLYFIESSELVARQLCDGTVPTILSDGSERWKKPPVTQATSVNANESVVVLSERNPGTTVKGFNAITGEKLWGPVQVSQKSPGPVAATDDALVFVSAGHLFGVNIRSGDTRFEFAAAADTPDPLTIDQAPQVGEVGDKTVVVTTGMAAYGVDISNGKQIWVKRATHPTRNTQWLAPAVSERFNCVVLANNDGEIFVLELTTGNPRWSTQVANTSQVSIAGDKVYVKAQGGAQFTVYELLSGKQACIVKLDDVGHVHVVAGHGILFTAGNDSIQGIPFSNQNAALFSKSREALITVEPTVEQGKKSYLDFGQGDFTVEAWIATTCGGEIISGFPTVADDKYHGFRINVTPQGRLRFSVINRTAANSFASISPNTDVADGYWHHVAVVRHNDAVEMYLDGVSLELDNARKGVAALDIGGNNVLTFGAFVPGQRSQAQSFFNGLIRELRIWEIALDASKLQSRMACTLVGKEPHMLGYWRMDEADISKLVNHVPRHEYKANVEKVISRATELALDKSAFPYLLDQVDLQWPYAGHWSAHGEESVTTSPALDRTGVLSFGAGNMLYGVNAADGARFWGVETPEGTSAPVASNGLFYAVTGAKGLISIDANTGAIGDVKGFGGLQPGRPPAGTSLSAPAIDERYTAAATPKGDVWIVERPNDPTATVEPWKWNTHDGAPGDLAIAGGRVYLVAGPTLYQLDPATKKSQSIPVANKHFHAQDDLVFCAPSAGKLVALSASDFKKQKAAFNVPDGANVTGLFAASDADLLVVATDKGVLYGLTYATLATRWTKNIPAGKATASKSLNAPTISGRTVFCTSASGAAAAVDARTGEFQSLFFEPTEITTPPLVDAGTIYFGCADAPPEALLEDGALHSVVFGGTHVLRLGVDYNGAPETAHGYASVTAGDVLELLGVDSCCVETWVNTREGGEVLSIAPVKNKYGLRLWLEKDGAIHFTCIDEPEDTAGHWQRITLATGGTPACDGRWHHIAVSRVGRKQATIYLDGIPVNATTKFEEEVAEPPLVAGLKVFIGADATAAAPANFFAGMIGEIRVWDTYLTATRIAERMHNKLIGNEPDLLAYWNFDLLSIHDGSRNGHEGKLETGGGSSGFWLADLNFTHPSYPYLETEGKIIQEGEEGGTGPLADTIFELVVTARKADGGVLGSHDITLWYVRHPGEPGADTITINSPKGTTKLQPVGPNHGDEQSVTATTGSNGKLTFRITTSQYGHGPAIDLRAAFLPSNERYHVSVLIDTQKLEKPAPPHLEAQSKLIQDYHWETGDKWDPQDEQRNDRRNRATWRAVITARNADGTVRPGERLQLWSHDHVDVEVSGSTYPINPNNYQAFTADSNGQLTVVFAATDLDVPPLSAWAAFMHRDERFTIPLDQEANGKLAEVNGDKLAKPQTTNWKPGYDPAKDNKPVVKEGYVQHAEKVATAIRHVMSVSQEPEKPKTLITARSKRVAELLARRNFADMLQAPPIPAGDGVKPLRTLRHINRRAPADLESFRQALDRVPEFKGSIGFSFEKTATGITLSPLHSLEQVQREFPRAFAAAPAADPEPLGNIFDDAWDAIENAAEAAWEAAKRVAIFIADQVTAVIDFADQTIKKVVNSVKEAVEAVVHIIKMIEAAIEDVIRILMLLFDWSGILKTQAILKTITQNQLKVVKDLVSAGQKDKFQSLVASTFSRKTGPMDLSKHEAAQVSANSAREQHNDPRVQAQVNSVHGKYVDSKMDDRKDQIAVSKDASPDAPKTPVDDAVEANVQKLSETFGGLLSNPLGVEFGEIYDGIKDLISGDISKFGADLTKAFLSNHNVLADMVTAIEDMINAEADIPFLSQLYKWITGGHTLTLLDVTCLALAIPTHVGYGIFTLIACDEVRDFSKDAAPLIADGDHESLTHRDHNLALHWCYFAFNFSYIMGSSILKGLQVVKGPVWRLDKELKWLVPGWYANGIVAKSLIFTANQKEAGWNDEETAWNSTLFGVLVCLDLYTIYDIWMGLEPSRETNTSKLVQVIKGIASLVGVVLLGIRLDIWINHKSDIATLFHVRGLLEALTMMLAFDDTKFFIDRTDRKTAGYFVLAETDLKFATIAVHIAGIVLEVKGALPPPEQPA
jgi:outer membrane protein assembly factor BamB